MLMIRLQRRGKKHQAAYRVVVGEKKSKLLGKQTDDLGWYDPHSAKLDLDKARLQHWLSKGAKMSATMNNLLVSAGLVSGKKIPVHKTTKTAGAVNQSTAVVTPEAQKTEEKSPK